MTLPPPPSQPSEPSNYQTPKLPPPPPGPPSGGSPSPRTPPPPVASNPYGGPPPGKKRANMAVIYGVIGLIPGCGFIFAILAIIFGLFSQKASRSSNLEPLMSAKAGVVLGVLGLVISLITLIVALSSSGR